MTDKELKEVQQITSFTIPTMEALDEVCKRKMYKPKKITIPRFSRRANEIQASLFFLINWMNEDEEKKQEKYDALLLARDITKANELLYEQYKGGVMTWSELARAEHQNEGRLENEHRVKAFAYYHLIDLLDANIDKKFKIDLSAPKLIS